MKKLIVLFFGLVIFLFIGKQVFAEDLVIPSEQPSPTPITSVDYSLPYPGLLPGNFLYPLKGLRDRIKGILISDPVQKADFDLLQADKHLNAGIMLFNDGQKNLAESTISKGEKYLEGSLNQAIEIRKTGRNPKELLQKLNLASRKHMEVIKDLEKQSNSYLQEKFVLSYQVVERVQKKVKELMPLN
jgi:hypothetical protein